MSGQKQQVTYIDRNGEEQSFEVRGKGNVQQFNTAAYTNDMNYQLAKEQNDWNLEQWYREAEYNSAEQMVQRLKDAGLNPNLYNGDGNQSGHIESADLANAQSPGPYVNPVDNFSNVANAALGMLDRAQKVYDQKIQTDLAQNQIRKTDSDISLQGFQMLNVKADSELKSETKSMLRKQQEQIDETITKTRAEVGEINERVNTLKSQGALNKAQEEYYQQENVRRNVQTNQDVKESVARIQEMFSRIVNNETQSQYLAEQTGNIIIDRVLKGQQVDMNSIQIDLMNSNKDYQKALNDFNEKHMNSRYYLEMISGYGQVITDGINATCNAIGTYYTAGLNQAAKSLTETKDKNLGKINEAMDNGMYPLGHGTSWRNVY